MDDNIHKLLDDLFDSFKTIDSKDIPNIDLYMDQVTTFMDNQLSQFKRNDDEKVLTKTMINNYAKNALLPSPDKKKYSKDHLILLILIYYLKNVMSINDIKKILDPVTAEFFGKKDGITLTDIYDGIGANIPPMVADIKADIISKVDKIHGTDLTKDFLHLEVNDQPCDDSLEKFLMIIMLTVDITIKKQLIENIIDTIEDKKPSPKEKEKDKEKDKDKDKDKE